MLDLKVNDLYPGATLDTHKGTVLKIEASAFGHKDQVPLEQLEIVAHGEVIKSITLGEHDQPKNELHIEMEVPVEHGMWISARCKAGPGQWAHTTPVYVHVDKLGHINSKTAPKYLELSEKYLQEIEEVIQRPHQFFDRRAWTYQDALQIRIDEARAILNDIGGKLE